MPNKTNPSWTEVPFAAQDAAEVHYIRTGVGVFTLSVVYEVKDSLGAIRGFGTLSQANVAYPVSAAAVVSAINAAKGT